MVCVLSGHWDTKAPDSNWIVTRVTFDKPVICPFSLLTQWYSGRSEGKEGLMSLCTDEYTVSWRKIPLVGVDWATEALSTTVPCTAPIHNQSSWAPTLEFSLSFLVQINHSVAAQARGKGCGISVRAETAAITSFSQALCLCPVGYLMCGCWC